MQPEAHTNPPIAGTKLFQVDREVAALQVSSGRDDTQSPGRAQTLLVVPTDLTAGLLAFLLFGWLGLNRFIDRDEGFYLLAASEVISGRTLYHEFFYPQMPLLPWAYGAFFFVVGEGWFEARLLTAFLSAMIAGLVFWEVRRKQGLGWAAAALLTLCTANFALPWFVVAKTYALSTLLLLGAVLIIRNSSAGTTRWVYLMAGVLGALSIQTRLFFLPAAGLILVPLLFQKKLREAAFVCVGLLLGSLPSLPYLLLDFDAFLFNNLGYHLSRTAQSLEVKLSQKLFVTKILFGFAPPGRDLGVHAPMLLYLLIASTVWRAVKGSWPSLPTVMTGVLFLLSLLPSPTYLQYFAVILPFLLIGLTENLHLITTGLRGLRRWGAITAGVALSLWYLSIVPSEMRRFGATGDRMIGVPAGDEAAQWSIESATAVAKRLNQLTTVGEQVMTLWPGYLVGSHAVPFQRFENHFGFPAALQVERARQRTLNLPSPWYVKTEIAKRSARIALTHPRLGPGYIGDALRTAGYTVQEEVAGVRFWVRGPEPTTVSDATP
jgi:hypothetical protein